MAGGELLGASLDYGEQGRAFLEGDAETVARVRGLVEQIVRSFHAKDGETPTDLVQEILSRLLWNLRAGRFRGDSSFETYVQSVARYTCIDARRHRRLDAQLDVETLPSAASWSRPEEWLIRREEFHSHLRAFRSLPPDCRELLRLIFVERRSYREVADRLGVTEGALKSRIHRCRLALRAITEAGASAESDSAITISSSAKEGENE